VNIRLDELAISGYLLALVRATAWLFIAPPFGGKLIPVQVRIGFAAALALTVGPRIAPHSVPLQVVPLCGAAVMQVAAGVALGYVGVILFGMVQAAGGMIDSFSGFNMAQMVDPTSTGMVSVFGRFYQLLTVTLLFAIDGHVIIVRGFVSSFDAASLTNLDFDKLQSLLTTDLTHFLIAALEVSAPIVAALVLTELALAVLAKAAPNMNVFVLGMPLKMLVTVTLAAVAIPLLPGAIQGVVDPVVRQGIQVVGG
jgi:flagellar biosynthetic protein FliR